MQRALSEAAEWIARVKVKDATATVDRITGAGTPLAAAAATTVVHVWCAHAIAHFLVSESVVDEGLHSDGAHGLEEVPVGGRAGLGRP